MRPTSAYWRTNFGGVPFPSPSRSWKTRTWPSQAGPGADADGRDVDRLGDGGAHHVGHPLDHEGEAAGRVERLGRVEQGAGGVGALALDPEAAHGEHRLGRQAEVAHDRDFGPDDRLDGREAGPAALELHGLRAGADEGGGVAHRVIGREVVAHPRHVAQDQAARLGPGHRRGVVRHDVDVDVQRVLVAEHVVGHRVADQDDVGAGFGHDPRTRLVVGRDHHDGGVAVAPLARPQRRAR